MSFWKLTEERRRQLVWDVVKQNLGAVRYVTKKKATSATMYTSSAIYIYDISIKSQQYVVKSFRDCLLYEVGDTDRYTVVHITVRPPFLKHDFDIYMPSPPTAVKGHRDSTTIATVSKTHYISDVRYACNIVHRLAQFIKYREEIRPLLITPEEFTNHSHKSLNSRLFSRQ